MACLGAACPGSFYLKWLCYTHKGTHVVAIVSQDKVPRAFGQFLFGKGYLGHTRQTAV